MNTPVSFELAKLLKEKGFDEETNKYYVQVFNDVFKLTHHRMWEMDEESGFQNAPHYLAPTIAEVVMWLYEKHNIWVYVFKSDTNQFLWSIDTNNREFSLGEQFIIPTEAYEAAIEYCLTKLI